jgi:hypothetical protein
MLASCDSSSAQRLLWFAAGLAQTSSQAGQGHKDGVDHRQARHKDPMGSYNNYLAMCFTGVSTGAITKKPTRCLIRDYLCSRLTPPKKNTLLQKICSPNRATNWPAFFGGEQSHHSPKRGEPQADLTAILLCIPVLIQIEGAGDEASSTGTLVKRRRTNITQICGVCHGL